jgi:GNAT superfamily N-acetyltransferase
MITIHKIDTGSKKEVNDFVDFPFQLFRDVPQWVPPIKSGVRDVLNRNKHPFHEHSDADFFLAKNGDEVVGRIAVLENKVYNKFHNKKQASFYLYDSVDDQEVANKLFECAFDWSHKRGLEYFLGPKGFSPFDGYGFVVEGFEHRQMMNMMNYNKANYPKFMENLGFTKVVDWVSCYAEIAKFNMPEKIRTVADKVRKQGKFKVHQFTSKSELKRYVPLIGDAYNKTFVNNWEYYPLTQKEVDWAFKDLTFVALPDLIKIITYKDEIVGFLLAFPDISAAFQRHNGNLTPSLIFDIQRELKKSDWIEFNGVGVLPEYQGFGGNALLFDEIEKTAKSHHCVHGELTNIAETAVQMRKDLMNLGVKPYKNHRIFGKNI